MTLEAAYDHFDEGKYEAIEWFKGEIVALRTGRVKPDLVDALVVEHYGTRMPLKGVATISNADARTLVVAPWDPSALTSIKKAITEANIGVQPTEDGKVVRLSFSTLTDEVREQTIKVLHKKAEEARVRLRRVRDEALNLLKKDKQESVITEDDWYDGKEKLNDLIDKANSEIDEVVEKKEAEIKTI
jgi:ribosome recycling factor